MKRILLPFFFLLSTIVYSQVQTWQDVGSGLNSSSHGMCTWNNMLVDAGSFSSPCGRVAAWNGTSWSCMASGVGLVGRECIEYNGNLVVVGDFWNINQPCTGCNGVAMWDGTQWSALGTGFNNDVLCLTIWNGMLVAGGDFTTADGLPCDRVAVWNGTNWSSLGGFTTTFNNDVRAITSYNGELWAGGDFTNAGGCTACDRIVKWNGTAWVGGNSGVDIPGGLDSTVRVLYVDPASNLLYLGGHFLDVGGNTNCAGVAVYNGTAWSALGSGVNSYVRAIHAYNGNIIVGGDFTDASGTPASKIAKWNPATSTWSAMGTGMNDYVKAMEVYNGELYAGGPFTTADGLPRSCIAKWYEIPAVPPTADFTMSATNLCLNQCMTVSDISQDNPTTWSWTFAGGTPSSSTLQNPGTICYNTPGTYNVTLQACNINGCDSYTQSVVVSTFTPPVVGVTASPSATICSGSSTTLTASGASSYTWAPATGLSATTGSIVSANPAVTTTYTVTGTSGFCSALDSITVIVNPSPTVTVTPSMITVCPSTPVVLTAAGASSYSWSPATALSSTTGSPVTATPASTITYTVTGTDNGCSATATSVVNVDVPMPLPLVEGFESLPFLPANWSMINDGNDGNVWQQNTSVGGFGTSSNCSWFPNNSVNAPGTKDEMRTMKLNFATLNTAQMTFDVAYCKKTSPSGSDTLSVNVSTDCGATWTQLYSKGGSTLATAANQNSSFTPAAAQWRTETINLNAYVGLTDVMFSFMNHNRNGNNLYIDNINITGTNGNAPAADFILTADTICPGSCLNFSDNTTGLPTSWTWTFNGASPSSSTLQNPGSVCWASTGNYTIDLQSCNGNGCTTISKNIVVHVPAVNAGNDTLICQNGSTLLHATGGTSYQWSPSTGLSCTNCASPVASPTVTTTYYVTATDAFGCSNTDSMIVTVDICMGMTNISSASSVMIYPNPFSSSATLHIENYNGNILEFEMYDVFGKRVKDIPITEKETRIRKEDLANGIYFWRLSNGGSVMKTGQVVVSSQ
jgi:PKD repeat protein